MQILLSEDQRKQLWDKAADFGDKLPRFTLPTVTKDRYGDVINIFEDWEDVRLIGAYIAQLFPSTVEEYLQADNISRDYPNLDSLIGDVVFSDQYATCAHCYSAICTDDPMPYFWLDEDAGDYICGDCLRANEDFAGEYLAFLARHLEDYTASVNTHLADPDQHGYVLINGEDQYCREDKPQSHPDFPSGLYGLSYADYDQIKLLGKAARLIDPNVQILFQYSGGSVIYWARFDPDANLEFAMTKGVGYWGYCREDLAVNEDNILLGYALTRIFAKWKTLNTSKK